MRRQLGKQKSQHTLAMGHQSGWLKLFCSYSPLRNGSRSSCLASHRIGTLLKDGGRLVRTAQLSQGKGLSRKILPQLKIHLNDATVKTGGIVSTEKSVQLHG